MDVISFAELQRRLRTFNVIAETSVVVADHAQEIVNIQRAQLFEGINGFDDTLERYADANFRDNSYSAKKNDQNPTPGYGNPDLYLTGSFYSRFVANLDGAGYTMTSTDSKTDKLVAKYGNGIFKLSTESKRTVRKVILQPNLVERLAQATGGQITTR